MTTSLKHLLYRELHDALYTSRTAFLNFCTTGVNASMEARSLLVTFGACELPGWPEFVTEFVFPLNETKQAILKILEFDETDDPIPVAIQSFLEYVDDWVELHTEFEKGRLPSYRWTARRNFPQEIDVYVDEVLIKLASDPDVRRLMLSL